MNNINYKVFSIGLLIAFSFFILMTAPVSAQEVELCQDDKEGADDAAQTIRNIFTILSALGPLFGTIFYVGLSVADAAKMEGDYSKEKRQVIISGFSVPIAIALFGAIANELVTGADVDCFFPGYE